MLDVPERVKELYRMDSIPKKFKIAFYEEKRDCLYPYEKLYPQEDLHPAEWGEPWLLIENDRLVTESVSLTESLCEGDVLAFGSCNAAVLEFTCADVIEDMTGKEFVISQDINGEYELIFGIYTVDSVDLQDNKRFKKVTASDRMLKFVVDVSSWYNSIKFPVSLKNLRESLCTWIGIQSAEQILPNDKMQVEKTINPETLNGREVLRQIGEINGTFPHIQRTGELKFIDLSNTGLYPMETLHPEDILYPSEPIGFLNTSQWRKVDFKEYVVPAIDLLQIRQEEGDVGISVGEGNNPYIVQGNFLVFGKGAAELIKIADNMFKNIKDRFYRPHTTVCNGLPFVEVGDGVTVILEKEAIESFVLKRTMTGIQALKDEFSAGGTQERKPTFGIKDQITQLNGKTAVLKRTAEELSNTITDVNADLSSKISQTVDSVTAEVKRAKEAESSLSIRADGIETNVSNFKEDTNSRFEQTADQIAIKVSKGDVSSQLSVESGQVTISSNRLIINSSNFTLSADGTTFANNGNFAGNIIASKITGSTISGSAITSVSAEATTTISDASIVSTGSDGQKTQIYGSYVQTREITANIINGTVSVTGSWNFGIKPHCGGEKFVTTESIYSNMVNPVLTGGGAGPNVGLRGINVASVNYCNATFQPLGVSDFRLKRDIRSMPNVKNVYMRFKPKSYKFKDSAEDKHVHFGLLAQQVVSALKKGGIDSSDIALVEQYEKRPYRDEGMYTQDPYRIKYEELHAWHIQMIQGQQAEIDCLKKEIVELREMIKSLYT